MTVQAELKFATNAAAIASEAAEAVTRFRGSLASLAGMSGLRVSLGSDVAGQLDVIQAKGAESAKRAAEQVTLAQLKAANEAAFVEQKGASQAAIVREKSAADLAKAEAKAAADGAAIQAKSDAQLAAIQASANAAVAQAEAQAKGKQALIYAKGDADRAAALNALVLGQSKASNDAYVVQVKGAEAARRAAEQAALTEQKGATQAAVIREKSAADIAKTEAKSAADRAKIEAKNAADIARDNNRAAHKAAASAKTAHVSEATTSGLGGAAKAILEGKGLGAALGSFGGKGAKIAAIGNIALSAGRAALNAAKEVAGISWQFGQAVVSAQAYREDVSEAFTTVTGSAAAGDAAMKRALATADKLGTARADTVGQFLDLTTKGFKVAEVERIVASLNDLTTIDPKASMEGLTKVIGKVQATGRLNQETLNELSTFGLEQSDVIKEIGKLIGKNDKDVLKALSTAGGIRGLGVEPILAAINKQVGGGPAGEKATEKANRNLSSLIKRVGEVPQNILFDLEVGPGLDNIKGVLKSVLGFFASGTATAERASTALGGAFSALVDGLFGAEGGDIGKKITEDLTFLVEFIRVSEPAFRAIGAAARLAFIAIGGFAVGVGQLFALLMGDSAAWATVAAPFEDLGNYIIDGLVGGISGGAQSVIDAVKSVASSAVDTAKSVLGIASPSKEFAQIGAWSTEGMALGIERTEPRVVSAATSLAEAGLSAASSEPFPLAMPGGLSMGAPSNANGGQPIVIHYAPVFNVAVPPGVDAAAITSALDAQQRQIIREEITAYFLRAAGA